MLRIVLIGSGKLAAGLAGAIAKTDCELLGFWGRNLEKTRALSQKFEVPFFSDIEAIPSDADIYFLCVSDNAIHQVANQLPILKGLVCHCSGGRPISDLNPLSETGVLWPIQSFHENTVSDFSTIPICIESESEENLRILEAFADRISKRIVRTNSNQRPALHLAAVMVNNFSNLLFTLANDYLHEQQRDLSLLMPLIEETVNRLHTYQPNQVQTGPAIRKDSATIQKHLDLLADYPDLCELYEVMTRLIQQRFKNGTT